MGGSLTSSDQMTFFLNLAVVGATLFGLTLVALSSFLPELMKRFEKSALPAFPHRDERRHGLRLLKPYSLSDQELMDGDPVVIFVAYSIGVSWNLFCMPLAMGFTAALMGTWSALICSVEFGLFLTFAFISLRGRQTSIEKMRIYMTREEPAWPIFIWIIFILMASTDLFTLAVALKSKWALIASYFTRLGWERFDDHTAFAIYKITCIFVLVLGTYTLNKDFFIYFKVFTLGKVRRAWLDEFLRDFESLKSNVHRVLNHLPTNSAQFRELSEAWSEGVPLLESMHDQFRGEDFAADRLALWNKMLQEKYRGSDWMLEVTDIAIWEGRVKKALENSSTHLRSGS
jgi:hypothetical protein